MTDTVSDKRSVALRFQKASESYAHHAVVQKQMAVKLADLALPHLTEAGRWFEFGCGTGTLTREILSRHCPESLDANDLVEKNSERLAQLAADFHCPNFQFISGDVEKMVWNKTYDAIWSGAALQWMTNLPDLLEKVSNSLNAGGIFAFSTFGETNYHQIKLLTGNGLNYLQLHELEEHLQAHFEVLHLSEWTDSLMFSDPVDVLRHIKATGVGGVSKTVWCKRQMHQFCEGYERFYDAGQGYSLTYHPIVGVVRKLEYK